MQHRHHGAGRVGVDYDWYEGEGMSLRERERERERGRDAEREEGRYGLRSQSRGTGQAGPGTQGFAYEDGRGSPGECALFLCGVLCGDEGARTYSQIRMCL